MKWLKRRFQKVWIPVGVVLSLVLTSFSGISFVQPGQVEAEETKEVSKELANPRIVPEIGQKVTWDCIWFGSYPQAEVVPASSEYTALQEYILRDGDLIQDDELYQTLQLATEWDEQGDIVIGDEKYRRITKDNATYTSTGHGYYNWKSETEYYYFKYQPIKWRVLSVNGSEAFLLADKVLDDKKYHTKHENVTWEGSTIRSWLNGYNASANIQNQDYSSGNFIDTAFGVSGQQAIKETYVENKDNLYYGTDGGNDTQDKIFLLSESETYTDSANGYGFISECDKYDGACDEARRAGSSVYAKSMGAYSSTSGSNLGNCYWWLRSPGNFSSSATEVDYDGCVEWDSGHVINFSRGVRPALNLNLTVSPDVASSNLWSYAGTVCSDGTVDGIKPENTPETNPSAKSQDVTEAGKKLSNPRIVLDSSMKVGQKVTWDCVWFGSYPQAEVVPANSKYRALLEKFLQEGDLIQDDELYQTLSSATGWDGQGDIVIGGEKYRRITKKNATSNSSGWYKWKNETEYHYFKYQPIKWRILSVNGSEAFLLADKVLDDKQYHTENKSVKWEGSTIRSWLNGYDASANIQNQDYSSKNFINTAFGTSEQQAIKETYVGNKDNLYNGTDGGNDTKDKIFLLSESETCTDSANGYGFISEFYKYDKARRAGSSVYAKSMGAYINPSGKCIGNCCWWLRRPGKFTDGAPCVNYDGWIFENGHIVNNSCEVGVRPALNLNLTASPDVVSSNLWSYAGTVCSDGTVKGIKPENTPEASPSTKPQDVTEAGKKLSNPCIVPDSSMKAGQKITWDCVWFGSYPQAEVVPASSKYTALPERLLQEDDLIQDDALYQTLQSATGWDEQGDIVINGEKYRRVTKKYAVHTQVMYYQWSNEIKYHYFKYQPIKWRVLSVNGSEAFLLADKALDAKQYYTKNKSVTWEGSTIRSWLNGYDASSNIQNQDYSSKNFINTAFGTSEQQAIKETYVENKDNLWSSMDGGNNTQDKVFLLSKSETYTNVANGYGFVSEYYIKDEARRTGSSVYAKSMGIYSNTSAGYVGNCYWWLRSSGDYSSNVARVNYDGWVNRNGNNVDDNHLGVRPALNLNLTASLDTASSNLWSYAGTVCSDWTVKGIKPENTPEVSTSAKPQDVTEAGKKLSNPCIVSDSSMKAGQKVTWDCVWFGSYPQAEVVPVSSEYTALSEELLQEGDLIQDDELYQKLQSATGWNGHGDIVVSGEKYRRITKENATFTSTDSRYYSWKNETEYHYFKYQPIKWRVLSVNGSEAFLLADKALDNKSYHIKPDDVTWESSTIRSWLNGYNASANRPNQDYSSENFIDTAFGVSGQQAIKETYVKNKDNIYYGTDGGNDTKDKIFLLSESETYTDVANGYGFVSDSDEYDEARGAGSSVYAKSMGIYSSTSTSNLGNCYWWLRSPGNYSYDSFRVDYDGRVYGSFSSSYYYNLGVRPALNLNLTASSDAASSNLWSYAGTVCSDRTVNEIKPENIPDASPSEEPQNTPEVNTTVKPSSKPQGVTEAGKKLSNPRIVQDSSMEIGQKVTWDCVWFGSYPQAEVLPKDVKYTALSEELLKEGDLIQDDELYQTLQSATGWNGQGDIVVNGEKYRRITKEDATCILTGSECYNWKNETEYHYFKYQPIKWRVLSVNGSEAFLLADKALDTKPYHVKKEIVTWEGSTIRSWLNGYDASANIQNQDYSSKNFINTAFETSEQKAIKETYVENKDNFYVGTDGGNDTKDKIFLLSESETYKDAANVYGFVFEYNKCDEARRAGSSVYAKSMGTYLRNCCWWLRSPGSMSYTAVYVNNNGWVDRSTFKGNVNWSSHGVRPALNLNLTVLSDVASSNLYSYAGTVCSDCTMNEIKPENTQEASQSPELGNTPEVNQSPKPATPFIPYNVPSGGGSVNVPTQTPDPTVLPTVSPAPTDVPVVPQTPKPTETESAPVPETGNNPSQTNVTGNTAKPDEETGNNSNIDNSDIDNSNTDNTNNSGNIKISKGSMVTDKKTKAVYKVIKNGKKNTVQYINNTKKNASSVTIPNKIKINGKSYKVDSIGKGAFKNNKKLKKVKIGKNIKTIGKGAFAGCKNLTDVEIGENVTEIKENAFSKCTSLVMVTIPAKVNKIGNRAFYKCKNLQYILVKSNKLMESNIGKEVFSGGFSTPRIKTDKSKWELYQKIFTARGMSQKALYIIDPVKLVP